MPAPESIDDLREQQFTLARHIRDPNNPPPPSIEDRRLAIYRRLFYNNIEGILSANFPVIRKTLGDTQWHELLHTFLRDYRSQTPLFTELPREFVRFIELRADNEDANDPPWLAELAHYEWVELALQLVETTEENHARHTIDGDLLDSTADLSPLAWPLGYHWPVHRISPDYQPSKPPTEATFLLIQRDVQFKVHFREISALTWRLLESIAQSPQLTARAYLDALAQEAGVTELEPFYDQGRQMLEQLRTSGVVVFKQ